MHSIREPKLEKVSRVFEGKGSKTNKEIFQVLAIEGPLSPYSLFKKLFKKSKKTSGYSVVNRRIRALANDGYVYVVGSQVAQKSRQKIRRYGLTLKGFVLSLLLIDYHDKVKQILTANSENVVFCQFFSDAIEKKRLTDGTVKDIFLDKLEAYIRLGYINVDKIPDYFLFKYARNYILHFSEELIDDLPKEARTLVTKILVDFRRLSHPETKSRFLDPYLDEGQAKTKEKESAK